MQQFIENIGLPNIGVGSANDSIFEYFGLQSWLGVNGPDRSSLSKGLFQNVQFNIGLK